MKNDEYLDTVRKLNTAFQEIRKVVEVLYIHNKKQAKLLKKYESKTSPTKSPK